MIGDDLAAALPELQQHAESRMDSRCDLRRPTGKMAQDEGTGREYPVWQTLAVNVPLRVRAATVSQAQSVPGGKVQTARPTGSVPLVIEWLDDVPAADREHRDGDHIDVTVGDTAGLAFVIREADRTDQTTARRFPVEAVARPEEWDL